MKHTNEIIIRNAKHTYYVSFHIRTAQHTYYVSLSQISRIIKRATDIIPRGNFKLYLCRMRLTRYSEICQPISCANYYLINFFFKRTTDKQRFKVNIKFYPQTHFMDALCSQCLFVAASCLLSVLIVCFISLSWSIICQAHPGQRALPAAFISRYIRI